MGEYCIFVFLPHLIEKKKICRYAYEIELDSYAVKEHNETKIAAMKKAKNKGGSDSESRVSDKELVYTKKSGSSAEKTRVTDSRVSESVGENLNSNINGKSG